MDWRKRGSDCESSETSESRTRRAIGRVQAHLEQHFNEPVSLDQLAIMAKLSRFHLLREFSRHTGLPPHAYQMRLRIEGARALLDAGFSASEAAIRVGFADQSHFTRHFKRIYRMTPGRYARLHAGRPRPV